MRKQVFGRKLKRDANERKALLKGLMEDLVMKESIKTTEEKAKAIRSAVEKLVTKAKVKGEAAERLLQPYFSPKAMKKMSQDLAKRFAKRPGGYVRIIKLGTRFGDNARMAVIEWVDKTSALVVAPKAEAKPAAKPAGKKSAARPAKTVGIQTKAKKEKK